MRSFIALNHCCARGLEIVLQRDRAWEQHKDKESVAWRIEEMEHLKKCSECNPDITTAVMIDALWPGAKVAE
jgi:hypothetical protein